MSRHRPPGHPNDWAMPDYRAFVDLVQRSSLRIAQLDEHPVQAVKHVSEDMGVRRGHWLIVYVLAGVYHKYALFQGHYFAETAEIFLRDATAEDLYRLGPDCVAWARKLAGLGDDK